MDLRHLHPFLWATDASSAAAVEIKDGRAFVGLNFESNAFGLRSNIIFMASVLTTPLSEEFSHETHRQSELHIAFPAKH